MQFPGLSAHILLKQEVLKQEVTHILEVSAPGSAPQAYFRAKNLLQGLQLPEKVPLMKTGQHPVEMRQAT